MKYLILISISLIVFQISFANEVVENEATVVTNAPDHKYPTANTPKIKNRGYSFANVKKILRDRSGEHLNGKSAYQAARELKNMGYNILNPADVAKDLTICVYNKTIKYPHGTIFIKNHENWTDGYTSQKGERPSVEGMPFMGCFSKEK